MRLLLPPHRKGRRGGRVPLVLLLPSSPEEQRATTRWRVDLATFLCSSLGAAVVAADGRGAGGKGAAWAGALRGAVGTADLRDQLAVLRWD